MHALLLAHRDDPEFEYRLLGDEAHTAGHDDCDRTMWRLCASAGWWSLFGKRRPKGGKHPGQLAHGHLVRRNFTAAGPDGVWSTDITKYSVASGGKLYLCAINEVFSSRTVGYLMIDRMTSQLAVTSPVARSTRTVDPSLIPGDSVPR